jgi:acyl-coenzyme A thioesterase PaaI-like protein
MDVIEIPFAKKVGIQRSAYGNLGLAFTNDVQNHIHTFHASAQFTLAESASGEILQTLFPELSNHVIPVLRESQIKFKKTTEKDVIAYPSVSDESLLKFNEQFSKKGRALISVNIEIKDTEGVVTCTCTYIWFVQKV